MGLIPHAFRKYYRRNTAECLIRWASHPAAFVGAKKATSPRQASRYHWDSVAYGENGAGAANGTPGICFGDLKRTIAFVPTADTETTHHNASRLR